MSDAPWALGLVSFLLFVLAGAVNYGYLSSTLLGGIGVTDLVVFGLVAAIAAVAFAVREGSRRSRWGGWE